jgi:hypothetical protein
MSPVAASIYCSPHPAALQIDTPPGSGGCLYDSAPGELFVRDFDLHLTSRHPEVVLEEAMA